MKVLVTGGTGVVGQAAVTEILAGGHTVRLLSRNAAADAKQWPTGVESWPASIFDQNELRGCAEGCELVLHAAGIVEETGSLTFETVNVDGTRSIVREAERCKVGRFIYVSSLGAETGDSPYHRSKRRAEDIVRNFAGAALDEEFTTPGRLAYSLNAISACAKPRERTSAAGPIR